VGAVMQLKASGSFLKRRTKKLFQCRVMGFVVASAHEDQKFFASLPAGAFFAKKKSFL
jgi:hypothetical protein